MSSWTRPVQFQRSSRSLSEIVVDEQCPQDCDVRCETPIIIITSKKSKRNRFAMILYLALFWSAIFLDAKAYELEPCIVLNAEGRCVLTETCPSAVKKLMKKMQHNYPRCGWSGHKEIICCPDASILDGTDPRIPANIRSTAACQNFSLVADTGVQPQILGGEEADVGEFPHMAALGYPNDETNSVDWGQCGGCLISYDYVLTAAHCLVRPDNKEPVVVRLGKTDLTGNSDGAVVYDFRVTATIVHPNYTISTKLNDIALLRLDKPISINRNVTPACLYSKSSDPAKFIVTGWGLTSSTGSGSNILLKTEVKSVDLAFCNKSYNVPPFPRYIYQSQLCAVSNDTVQRDTCQGDSGGPAQIRTSTQSSVYTVIGITSYGRGCGGNTPSIYSRVSSYVSWIESIVWP